MTRYTPAALLVALTACTSGTGAGADAGEGSAADAAGDVSPFPAAVCVAAPAPWQPGDVAFTDATAASGFADVDVRGTGISLGDIDGDGWIDAIVRRNATALEPADDAERRRVWVMRNRGDGTFEDITDETGLRDSRLDLGDDVYRPVHVVALADVDNDGALDIYNGLQTADLAATGGETSELLRNAGGGVFSLTRAENAVRREGELDAPAGAAFLDANHDGRVDLWLGQHNVTDAGGDTVFQPDRLLLGNGDGTFDDVTQTAGLVTEDWIELEKINAGLAHSRAWSATACDLNNDGHDELLAASYGRAPNLLWQAQPRDDGTIRYVNRSVASGYAYDDDLTWSDNEFARCYCASNRDAEGCADVPAPRIGCSPNWSHATDREPFRLGGNSGATVCADLDNDGWLDLVTTEIRHWWAGSGADGSTVLWNTGEADVRLERAGRDEIGLVVPHVTSGGWDEGHIGATVLDFDNDGWLDIFIGATDYAGNRALLYRQVAPRRFEEVAVDDWVEHNRSHGVGVADIDRDGDLDLIVGHSRARCDASAPNDCYATDSARVLRNELQGTNNWLQVRVDGGTRANRGGVGAVVTVRAGGITQTRRVEAGYGHYGAQNDLVQHFGLGSACEAEVTVQFAPGVASQTWTLPAGHRFRVDPDGVPAVEER
jgi:hypothetical protein